MKPNVLITILFITVLILAGCEKDATAPIQLDTTKPPAITLDNKAFDLKEKPIMYQGNLYLPFEESLKKLGIRYDDYDNGKFLAAHYDNHFIKIDTENLLIYRNGNQLVSKFAPLQIKDVLYIQGDLLFQTFHIKTAYPNPNSLHLSKQGTSGGEILIDGEYFTPIKDTHSKITFSVPKNWERLPGSPFRFGTDSDFEKISVTYRSEPRNKRSPEAMLADTEAFFQTNTSILPNKTSQNWLQSNGMDGLSAVYEVPDPQYAGKAFLYIYYDDKTLYSFYGEYTLVLDANAAERLISAVSKSLKLENTEVDIQREYYLETSKYFDDGLNLTSKLYSNMEVKDAFNLEGTIRNSDIRFLYAVVSRGGESVTIKVPIKDKAFKGFIQTPFGLGKHDITLYSSEKEMTPEDRILQVSVVDTSNRTTRWVIPSELVNSDSEFITSQSNMITFKIYSDYVKAQKIFTWVAESVQLDAKSSEARVASDVYLKKIGTEQETVVLYTALLRAAEIPARITYSASTPHHYWVQLQLNGRWVDSDVVAAMKKVKSGSILQDAVDAHFNMPKTYFEEKFPGYEFMSD